MASVLERNTHLRAGTAECGNELEGFIRWDGLEVRPVTENSLM
jgi:hypothetical protein